MLDIRNEIAIQAPQTVVFDLLTTTGYWPQWHLSTRAVSGVTDRPYALGEAFEEHAEMAGQQAEIHWRCVAHDGPRSAALESREQSASIAYTLDESEGQTTISRRLQVNPAVLRGMAPTDVAAHNLLWDISQRSLERFRVMVMSMRTSSATSDAA
jgi:hypothetical protein